MFALSASGDKFHITEAVPKAFRQGTHRSMSPQSSLERVLPLLPVMGITRIANVTGLDRIGIPVIMVCRPNSRSLSVTQGKGFDIASAKISGVMEAIESYHAEYIVAPLKSCSYEELRYTHKVVDVENLPTISGSRFHPNLRILWIEGHDLLNDEPVWVPYELVHTDYTFPLPEGSGCFAPSSNGLASGNHLLEATSHAICEVIERDATTVWNMRKVEEQQETRLDPCSVDDPLCRAIMEKFDESRVSFAVWEVTTDVGLPAFVCTIADHTDKHFRPLYAASGMGCHLTREIALLRALTEAAQSRLTFIAGSRDDATRQRYEHGLNSDVLKNFQEQIEAAGPTRGFGDAPTYGSETLNEDVAWALDRLKDRGIDQVIAVDLTKVEFGIPVVRVVIPGLEGTDRVPGYLPGKRARKLLGSPE